MKKQLLTLIFILSILPLCKVNAQSDKTSDKEDNYRRSSLCLLLIDDDGMPKREVIKEAFLNTSIPNKYNDHNIDQVRIFTINPKKLTSEERTLYTDIMTQESGKKKKGGGFNKVVAGVASAAGHKSVMLDDADKNDYAICAYKYLLEQQVAKQLFDMWFIDDEGAFNVDLIRERGLYDASEFDVQTAKSSLLGMAKLQDAGEELIKNTFVVVSRYRYMSKEEMVKEAQSLATTATSLIAPSLTSTVSAAGTAVNAAVGGGYYIRAMSLLFQLEWNDDIADKLYSELWDNKSAYDVSDIFNIKYLGMGMASAGVKATIFTNKPEEELIRIATINSTDAVLAQLADQYEVFRTKTPLIVDESGRMSAYIGTKEGLTGGEKFEVLEQSVDPETGKTVYSRKGVIKVDKSNIWQNHYMADEELEAQGLTQDITATVFEGKSNKYYTGMLLRQIK